MFDSANLDHKVPKEAYRLEEAKLREALLNAQFDLKQAGTFPVLILIAGVEGAGKGETVNLLNAWMDPGISAPTLSSIPARKSWSVRRCGVAGGRCRRRARSASSSAPGTPGPSSSA